MTSEKAIISILNEQVNTYKVLLDLLKKERIYLVEIDAEKIEAISKEKDTVVMKLRLLEEERIRLIQRIADEHGTGTMNLEELARFTGDKTFLELRAKLKELLQHVDELNKFNGILISRSIQYLKTNNNFFSSFITGHGSQATGVLMSKES